MLFYSKDYALKYFLNYLLIFTSDPIDTKIELSKFESANCFVFLNQILQVVLQCFEFQNLLTSNILIALIAT